MEKKIQSAKAPSWEDVKKMDLASFSVDNPGSIYAVKACIANWKAEREASDVGEVVHRVSSLKEIENLVKYLKAEVKLEKAIHAAKVARSRKAMASMHLLSKLGEIKGIFPDEDEGINWFRSSWRYSGYRSRTWCSSRWFNQAWNSLRHLRLKTKTHRLFPRGLVRASMRMRRTLQALLASTEKTAARCLCASAKTRDTPKLKSSSRPIPTTTFHRRDGQLDSPAGKSEIMKGA